MTQAEYDRIYRSLDIAIDWASYGIRDFPCRQEMLSRNERTLFSGWGGEEYITHHGDASYIEMFYSGHWIAFAKAIYHRARKTYGKSISGILKTLYFKLIVPSFPKKYYCKLPRIHCRKPDYSIFEQTFCPLIEEEEKKKNYIFTYMYSKNAREEHIRAWENGHVESRIQSLSQESMGDRVQYVFPLLDRRLVEFAFSIPAQFMFHRGYDRYLYRTAIADLLPETVLWGIHKDEEERIKQIKKFYFTMLETLLKDQKYSSRIYSSPYLKDSNSIHNNHKITALTAILCSEYLNR
jgi:hypothetical protein